MKTIKLCILLIIGLSVACQKDDDSSAQPDSPDVPENNNTGTVTDVDGNEYSTIIIGDQEWMAENLRTTKYCNGDNIRNIRSNSEWRHPSVNGEAAAWAHYNNDSLYETLYGKLYNWYVIADERNVCPCGWHVPSHTEWEKLIDYLGGDSIAGGKMKSSGTQYWESPNANASNESGFSALPGGSRDFNATFDFKDQYGYWWVSTYIEGVSAWCHVLSYDNDEVTTYFFYKTSGLSIRCVKD